MSSARPASRALGLKLVHQERGTQYYRPRKADPQSFSILMQSARGNALDVSLRTAYLLGSGLAFTAAGTTCEPDTSNTLEEYGQRHVLLLCEDVGTRNPALGIRVQGSFLERPYYPDVLAASDLPERTVDTPEAIGFAAAVSRLCGPHEVLIGILPPEVDAALQRRAISEFAALAQSSMQKHPATFRFADREREALQACSRRLKLSAAERTQLEHATRAARIRGTSTQTVVHLISEATNARTVIEELEQTSAE